MNIGISRITFDPSNTADSHSIGSYLRSSDGTLLTHTTIGGDEALDVNIVGQTGVYNEDDAHASGDKGSFILAVRNDVEGALAGTDGDYAPLQVDALGRLRVAADISVSNGFEKIEDSAHASGDVGGYVLSVRQDTLASSAADGDYQSFKTDSLGRLHTIDAAQSAAYGAKSIAAVATDIVTTDLVNRRKILVQNLSNKNIFIGSDASVTTVLGIKLSPESSMVLEISAGVNVHAITASGTADVRYFELA